jgi:hypothetical protein
MISSTEGFSGPFFDKIREMSPKRDISAVETSFELSSLPLYRSSHTFQNLSLTGARILKNNGLTVTKDCNLSRAHGVTSNFSVDRIVHDFVMCYFEN